jgi:hypothetical protein
MAEFSVGFKIEDRVIGGRTYAARYDALSDAINTGVAMFWEEPTTYVVISTTRSIDALAAECPCDLGWSDCDAVREVDGRVAARRDRRQRVRLVAAATNTLNPPQNIRLPSNGMFFGSMNFASRGSLITLAITRLRAALDL